jgi:hypothetical protein
MEIGTDLEGVEFSGQGADELGRGTLPNDYLLDPDI